MRTAADIRRRNSFAVVRSIHAHGDASRRELAELTGLSFATVATICSALLEHGVIAEVARERAPAGRPTAKLSLNGEHGLLLGIDIAETYVHAEAFDAALEPISSTECDIDVHERSPDHVVERVKQVIAAERARHEGRPLLGVGVSAPGQVDPVGGTSVFAPNWDWHDVPLRALLADSVDAPLFLDNPLKSLAIAEMWSHPERREQDFVVLNLGTGVGAGIALGGRVLRGRMNSAGEWGHTVVVADGRACRCGSRGCVEAYVGAPGILQSLRETSPDSPLLHGDDQTATVTAIAEAADQGDPTALEVVERTSRYLGVGAASIVNLLNPDIVLLGGWVAGLLGKQLLERARVHLRAHALAVPMTGLALDLQHPRGNSVSLGAAAFALEGYLESMPDGATDTPTSSRRQPAG
ncbi:ROK family transcriptional regulator [Micromonospora sp. DT227]|uniref:ROK family transcriptional regulator n=1 Tax=Micromonospora sp. DT227 TaxID=3393433 RepID=UPI003CEF94E1